MEQGGGKREWSWVAPCRESLHSHFTVPPHPTPPLLISRQSASGLCCLPRAGSPLTGPAPPGWWGDEPGDAAGGAPLATPDDCGVCGGGSACALTLTLTFASAVVGGPACTPDGAAGGSTPGRRPTAGYTTLLWPTPGGTGPARAAASSALRIAAAAVEAGVRSALGGAVAAAGSVAVNVTAVTCVSGMEEAGAPAGRFRVSVAVRVGPWGDGGGPSYASAGVHTAVALLALQSSPLQLTGEPGGGAIAAGGLGVAPAPRWVVDARDGGCVGVGGVGSWGGMGGGSWRGSVCGNGVCEAGEACGDGQCTTAGACAADCSAGSPVVACPAAAGVGGGGGGVCGGPGRGACVARRGACSCAEGWAGVACTQRAVGAGTQAP